MLVWDPMCSAHIRARLQDSMPRGTFVAHSALGHARRSSQAGLQQASLSRFTKTHTHTWPDCGTPCVAACAVPTQTACSLPAASWCCCLSKWPSSAGARQQMQWSAALLRLCLPRWVLGMLPWCARLVLCRSYRQLCCCRQGACHGLSHKMCHTTVICGKLPFRSGRAVCATGTWRAAGKLVAQSTAGGSTAKHGCCCI
jgi:hypothetical protein